MSTEIIPDFLAQYGHHFQNNAQLNLALTAAGTERNNIEGNRLLAQVGDSVLDTVLSLRAFEQTQSRAELSFTKQLVLSSKQRAEVATRTGITQCIRYPPGCEGHPERLRAAAVSAIIGAAFLQSGRDINQAGMLVDHLGLCMSSVQFATAQAAANGLVNDDRAWDRGGPAPGLGTSVGPADWQSLETSLQMIPGHNSDLALSQAQSAAYVNGNNTSISFSCPGPSIVGVIAQMQPADHYSENLEAAATDNDDISHLLEEFRSNMTAEVRRSSSVSRTKDQALLRYLTEALGHSSMQNRFQELVMSYNSLEEAQRPVPQEDSDIGQRFKRIEELAGPSPVLQLLRAGHMLALWNSTSEDNFVDVSDSYPVAVAPAGISGNPRSQAISAMTDDQVRQIFPGLDPLSEEYADKRTKFTTVRRQGRNLYSFVDAFGVGVLGLLASLPSRGRNRNVIDGRLSRMSSQGIKQTIDDLSNATNGAVRRNSHIIEPHVLSMLQGIQFVDYDLHTHVFE